MLAGGGLVDDLVLQDPSEVVGDEDGVQAGGECGIDVGTGTVADHPGAASFTTVMRGERAVGFVVLFGQDLDGREVRGQARAPEFVGLFFRVAFGDHDEAVTGR